MDTPKVIGEGTYGCVHDPSLECNERNINYKDKVSKILSGKHARQELDEYLGIQRADPKNQFFLGVPIKCKPKQNESNQKAIKKCSIGSKAVVGSHIKSNYELLIMQNGGMNLFDFAVKMGIEPANLENQRIMESFWIEVHRLFLGLSVFVKENILHHDLKGQNIVYNPTTNRIAFIDFGLMRPLDSMKKYILLNSGTENLQWLTHWSYPVETMFYEYSFYKSPALKKRIIDKLDDDLENIFDEHFLHNILPRHNKDSIPQLTRMGMNRLLYDDFKDLINETNTVRFPDFVKKSVETFDLYGVCMGLMFVWNKTYHIMRNSNSKIDYAILYRLLYFGFTPCVNSRYTVDQALHEYERLLFDILKERNTTFVNHVPVKNEPTPHLHVDKMSDKEFQESTEKEDKKVEAKICPPGKVLNPFTGRCVKECAPGKQRDDKFRCKTVKRTRVKLSKKAKSCPDDKELNPNTNRCVLKCKPGKERDENFRCKTVKVNR